MKLGVVFPQTEIGQDSGAVKDYVQTAESCGYNHIVAFDHVVGANPGSRPNWKGFYSNTDMFHEILVLFGYISAITEKIGLVSGILILPQRQTVLVAKQAAAIDVLSNGRLRLGIGVGWNQVEYEALGENFHNRGKRCEEQIKLLRSLWTEELVTFNGTWHKITDAGLNPLPIQRPIPIWMGGISDNVLERIGKLADGWYLPGGTDPKTVTPMIEKVKKHARDSGRDPDEIMIECSISIADGTPDDWRQRVLERRDFGVTHLSINTMNGGLSSAESHIKRIEEFMEVWKSLNYQIER